MTEFFEIGEAEQYDSGHCLSAKYLKSINPEESKKAA